MISNKFFYEITFITRSNPFSFETFDYMFKKVTMHSSCDVMVVYAGIGSDHHGVCASSQCEDERPEDARLAQCGRLPHSMWQLHGNLMVRFFILLGTQYTLLLNDLI